MPKEFLEDWTASPTRSLANDFIAVNNVIRVLIRNHSVLTIWYPSLPPNSLTTFRIFSFRLSLFFIWFQQHQHSEFPHAMEYPLMDFFPGSCSFSFTSFPIYSSLLPLLPNEHCFFTISSVSPISRIYMCVCVSMIVCWDIDSSPSPSTPPHQTPSLLDTHFVNINFVIRYLYWSWRWVYQGNILWTPPHKSFNYW